MYIYVKRVLDLLLSLILIILLMPLFIVVSILIKKDSNGPIIFAQKRSGKNNKVFNLYKFRTMTYNNNVYDLTVEDKVTKIGKFLRKSSIDELPQLFNILKGEMSFIGPRPWIVDYAKYFTKKQFRRLEVLPGITGLAQANGRNCLSILDKIKYDLVYVNNISFKIDVYVIYCTIKNFFKTNSYESGKMYISNELSILKDNQENSNEKELVNV